MTIPAARRVRARLFWLLGTLLAIPAQPARAAEPAAAFLDPQLPVSQYHHEAWGSAAGLPQNTVGAIAPTPDGYLWLATQDGLARFDGVRFTVFDESTTPEIINNDIAALAVDRQGRLWVGTNGGGLLLYEAGRFTRFTTKDGLPGNSIARLVAADDGTLWIGTARDGLAKYASGRFAAVPAGNGLIGNAVTAMALGPDGQLWVGTRAGLMRLAHARLQPEPLRAAGTSDDVRALRLLGDGSLLIGTTRGVARWKDGRMEPYEAAALAKDFVAAILEDAAGTLWIGTRGGGLIRISGREVTRIRAGGSLSEDDVLALHADRFGALWVGCNTGGLNRLSRATITAYGRPEGMTHDLALPIVQDRDGAAWVGTYGGGVNRYKDGQWSAFTTRQGLASDQILSLLPARDGSVWVGSRGGLDRIVEGRVQSYTTRLGLAGPVVSLYETRSGDLWVGLTTGLVRVTGGPAVTATRKFTTADGLPSNYVTVMYEGHDGTFWIGTDGGGLGRRDGERFAAYTTRDGFPDDSVWAIHEDREGTLWFGTNTSGLVRRKAGRFTAYGTRNGLFNNVVFQVLEDDHDNLWMSSPRGISRVRKSDILAFDAGRVDRLSPVAYGDADGMRSTDCNGAVEPAGWRMRDGSLWFPTIKGVAVVDPARAVTIARPSVVLEEVMVDGEARALDAPVRAQPGARDFQFRYTALDSPSPARVRFRYRLDGFDRQWVYAGSGRTARYMNLPPGHYDFAVEASAEPGEWIAASAPFAIVLEPHFYATYWFYALCALGVVVVAGTFYAVRVSALKSGHREVALLAEARARALEENTRLLEEVEKERRRFESLLAAAPGLVWEIYETPDPAHGRIPFVSAHLEPMLGYTVQEWLSTPDFWLTIVHPEDRADAERTAADIFKAGFGQQRFRWVARDGRILQVEARYAAIRDASGAIIGMRGVTMDVSERRQLEDQLRQAQKMEAVGRLAGGVAHDFNNLLTAIIGNSELLEEEVDTSNQMAADALGEIKVAADRAAGLTRQLLAFSRRQVLEPTVLDLGDLVAKTSGLLRRLIGEDIELSTRLGHAVWQIRADRGQIEQVVMNLAVNARDAMPTGGKLTIEVDRLHLEAPFAGRHGDIPPGRYVMLAVSDTGHGMDAETQAHIFEPFFTTKEVGRGTGLGLATVYGIIEQSGGHIWVYSEVGRGTTFKVLLPQVEEASESADQAGRQPRVPGGTETVLIVEDEPGVRALARKVLTRGGYTVLEASNGDEAIRVASDFGGGIDLVLTDCVMPGPSGPVLVDRLAVLQPRARVLFMSGYTDHAALQHELLRDGAAFLQKPFTPDDLATVVRQSLDDRSPGAAAENS